VRRGRRLVAGDLPDIPDAGGRHEPGEGIRRALALVREVMLPIVLRHRVPHDEPKRRRIENVQQRRPGVVAEPQRLEPEQRVARAVRQVGRLKHMAVLAGRRGVHHQDRAVHRPDRPLCRRADEHVPEHLPSMRPDDEKVGRGVRYGLNDAGEGIGEDNARLARHAVDFPKRGSHPVQKRRRLVTLDVHDTARLIVVDDMDEKNGGIEQPGQQGRAPKRPVRPLGKIRRHHDFFHRLGSRAVVSRLALDALRHVKICLN